MLDIDYGSGIITSMENEELNEYFFYYAGFPNEPLYETRCAGRKIFKTYYSKQEIIKDLISLRLTDPDVRHYMQMAFGENVSQEFTPFARRVINTAKAMYGLLEEENPYTKGNPSIAHKMAKEVLKDAVCLIKM
tara:strand:- start:1666 stop:2067 length:402 start_codon:yes stop_codon:yes gene_type:complete